MPFKKKVTDAADSWTFIGIISHPLEFIPSCNTETSASCLRKVRRASLRRRGVGHFYRPKGFSRIWNFKGLECTGWDISISSLILPHQGTVMSLLVRLENSSFWASLFLIKFKAQSLVSSVLQLQEVNCFICCQGRSSNHTFKIGDSSPLCLLSLSNASITPSNSHLILWSLNCYFPHSAQMPAITAPFSAFPSTGILYSFTAAEWLHCSSMPRAWVFHLRSPSMALLQNCS